MGYDIKYHRAAEKYLDSQTNAMRERIMDAIDDLPEGNVLFDYVDDSTIDVVTIVPRGDVYKK